MSRHGLLLAKNIGCEHVRVLYSTAAINLQTHNPGGSCRVIRGGRVTNRDSFPTKAIHQSKETGVTRGTVGI